MVHKTDGQGNPSYREGTAATAGWVTRLSGKPRLSQIIAKSSKPRKTHTSTSIGMRWHTHGHQECCDSDVQLLPSGHPTHAYGSCTPFGGESRFLSAGTTLHQGA